MAKGIQPHFTKGEQMAKDKVKKSKASAPAVPSLGVTAGKPKKSKKPKKAKPEAKAKRSPKAAPASKAIDGAVRAAKDKVVEIASNPVVAEVVAATLVAAAAALRNPDKARELARSAGDELGSISKSAVGKGGAFWKLATDIARQSIASLNEDSSSGARSSKGKKSRKG